MSQPGGRSDRDLLLGYVDVWWHAVVDLTHLLESLPAEQWSMPTDLPGWDVHAVAAHTAHLEAVLAGAPEETVEVEPAPHVRGLMGLYTEQGVVARRDRTPDELVSEIRTSAAIRHALLLADPPTDASARPAVIFGGVPWDWRTLLRNRPLDVWMHEQDVRRAVGRPGGLDSAAAKHTADYLAESLPMVVAKRVGAPAGTTVVLRMPGSRPLSVRVNTEGRGVRVPEVPADPTVRISTDRETFVCLAGGRRAPAPGEVGLDGDQELGHRILDAMAVTP
ncbi:MAG: maleylpyruvate isomerase family mycothiol-dependent enzyme [Nocardioidaceae bacterium]